MENRNYICKTFHCYEHINDLIIKTLYFWLNLKECVDLSCKTIHCCLNINDLVMKNILYCVCLFVCACIYIYTFSSWYGNDSNMKLYFYICYLLLFSFVGIEMNFP